MSSQEIGYVEGDYNYDFDENKLGDEIITNNVEVLEEYQINKERKKSFDETKEKLCLDEDKAKLVMIYYNWNLDKLVDWYENVEEIIDLVLVKCLKIF